MSNNTADTPTTIQQEPTIEPVLTENMVMLANILKNWEDDSYKLVYADFLEERYGQVERANLIRVQCELADWNGPNPKPRAYGNWYVDCRNIQPVSEAGTEDICYCPRSDGKLVVCEYHTLKEDQKTILQDWQKIVGPDITRLMPTDSRTLQQYSNNNFGVQSAFFTPTAYRIITQFKIEKGLVTELACDFQDWAVIGVNTVKLHPIRKLVTSPPIDTKGRDILGLWGDGRKVYDEILEFAKLHPFLGFNDNCLYWARQVAGYWETCQECKGSGFVAILNSIVCKKCKGKGWNSSIFE